MIEVIIAILLGLGLFMFFVPVACGMGIEGMTTWDIIKDNLKKRREKRVEK